MTATAEKLIFEFSKPGRGAHAQMPPHATAGVTHGGAPPVPEALLRRRRPRLPEVSELDVVRHFTRLSQLNFSIDTHFYPLGSCTMKYNPRGCNQYAMLPQLLGRHPLAPASTGQGVMSCLYELQEMLSVLIGMPGVSLTPMAGAQGEFAGVAMIRAYHVARGDLARTEIIVPEAAHGTNPATATLCGYSVREVPVDAAGDVQLDALAAALGPQTAGIMLTNPSTLGVFERRIEKVAAMVHEAGGLLYYDGANLNAILGKVRPGDMGFDVMHMNLHKTFSTPHGGGGPGAGAVGVGQRLLPFMPVPYVGKDAHGYHWLDERVRPQTIGRLSAFMGNVGVLLRAYIYIRMIGREGAARIAEYATLNANYLLAKLTRGGFEAAYPGRRASHEFALTLRREAKELDASAMDFAKRLLDFGYHAPTTYFPLMVPECLLIEPTETETRETLDGFVAAMLAIRREAAQDATKLHGAPYTMPVRRLDDVRAARQLDLSWTPGVS
jgi:glycine dehydrogenase subunit 2